MDVQDVVRGRMPGRRLVLIGNRDVKLPSDLVYVPVTPADARADDLVLTVVLDDDLGTKDLEASWSALPDGVLLVAVLGRGAADLPVGLLVDLVVRARVQVLQVLPTPSRLPSALLVGRRVDGPELLAEPYLDGRGAATLDEAGVRRLLAERVVEGVAVRSRHEVLLAERDRLTAHGEELAARCDALTAQRDELAGRCTQLLGQVEQEQVQRADVAERLEATQERLAAVTASRRWQAAQALADARRHPIRGAGRLRGLLRGERP